VKYDEGYSAMTALPPDRAREIFEYAVKEPASKRTAFLSAACQGNQELRSEVERMLAGGSEAARNSAGGNPISGILSSGDTVSHYRIEARLGAGGMGVIYLATDVRLQRQVALKVINPDFPNLSQREARAVAALNHANICTLHDVGTNYLVMEYVEGPTLAERIEKGPIPAAEALAIARQIALALEAAHERGVVHRDLKPANIKLTADDKVKVLDFGLAKVRPPDDANPDDSPTLLTSIMQPGTILGTAPYMSPEQASGKPVDKLSDIWSFGVVLWEMLTGRRLFAGETATHIIAEVMRGPIDFDQLPAETPPRIRHLLRRCLDRDVKNRLRDIGEARIAIDAPAEAEEPDEKPQARRRAPVIWMAAAAVLVLLLAGVSIAWFRKGSLSLPRLKAEIAMPGGEGGLFGISPDGRFLTFSTCEAFTCKLAIRPLDSLEVVPIGDGSLSAFWSPNSSYVVYESAGKLYKLPSRGGAAVSFADTPPGYNDGAWLDAGTIVMATDDGLYSIPEAGGALSKVASEAAQSVTWLPAGQFLYSNEHGVFATSLRGEKPVQVLPDNVDPTYVPPSESDRRGWLVFARSGALLAQEFDVGKLQVVGDPVHVVPSGSDPGGVYVGDVEVSRTGVLGYRTGNGQRVALTWYDRSGKRLQTVSEAFDLAGDATNRLSPDDSRAIVNAVSGPNQQPDLWIADFARGTFSRFTFTGSDGGLWSPDGARILWGDLDYHLSVKAADGSGSSEPLFKNPNCPVCLIYDWSQDGRLVSFATYDKRKVGIALAPLDGDRKPYPFRDAGFNDFYGMFSPDHHWLAYTSDESGQNQIYIESIPAGKKRWQVSTEGGNWPIWRHDGKELFYRQGRDVMAVPAAISASDLQIGKPQKLFTAPIPQRFLVSRDGQRFLLTLPVEDIQGSPPIVIDNDWRAGLKK
jgi:predicted Ser/Thr protein kinase